MMDKLTEAQVWPIMLFFILYYLSSIYFPLDFQSRKYQQDEFKVEMSTLPPQKFHKEETPNIMHNNHDQSSWIQTQ